MYIEINDPTHCTFITQPPGAKLPPQQGQSRVCGQCNQQTWAHTSTCMWCGFDRWALPARIGLGVLALIATGLVIFRLV